MKNKNLWLKAMGIAAILMAFCISGNAQNASGSAANTGSHPLTVASGGNAASIVSVQAAQIPGFGWHSTEGATAFEGRLATNLGVLRTMPGATTVDYNKDTKEIRMIFSQNAPGPAEVVRFASPKITKCTFDVQQR